MDLKCPSWPLFIIVCRMLCTILNGVHRYICRIGHPFSIPFIGKSNLSLSKHKNRSILFCARIIFSVILHLNLRKLLLYVPWHSFFHRLSSPLQIPSHSSPHLIATQFDSKQGYILPSESFNPTTCFFGENQQSASILTYLCIFVAIINWWLFKKYRLTHFLDSIDTYMNLFP